MHFLLLSVYFFSNLFLYVVVVSTAVAGTVCPLVVVVIVIVEIVDVALVAAVMVVVAAVVAASVVVEAQSWERSDSLLCLYFLLLLSLSYFSLSISTETGSRHIDGHMHGPAAGQ